MSLNASFRFNALVSPTLQLTAFAYKGYVRFGFVDQGHKRSAQLLRQYSINTYAPSLLLFKENTDKPVDIIQVAAVQSLARGFLFFLGASRFAHIFFSSQLQARGMKRQIMDEFVSNNKFLQVPRLVNQQLFDELCPVKQFHRRRK